MDKLELIEEWGRERGLDKADSTHQLTKLIEEVGELATAHNKNRRDDVIDSLGDSVVVLTIYAMQNGLSLSDCIDEAYDTIKNRKGKMQNGVFVKDGD